MWEKIGGWADLDAVEAVIGSGGGRIHKAGSAGGKVGSILGEQIIWYVFVSGSRRFVCLWCRRSGFICVAVGGLVGSVLCVWMIYVWVMRAKQFKQIRCIKIHQLLGYGSVESCRWLPRVQYQWCGAGQFFALVHVFGVRCSRFVCAFVRSKGVSVDRSRYVVVLGVRIVDGRRTKV